MSMVARRRRRAPGDSDEEDQNDQEEPQLPDEQLVLEDGEEGEVLEGPRGPPTTLTPMTPLFTPEQLRGLHEAQSQASHLYAQAPRQSVWQPGMGLTTPRLRAASQ